MAMELDDLKFNFGCASCGYKHQDPDGPIGTISVKRVIEKLDEHFAVNDMAGAGRLLDYWRQEAFTLRDRQGELSIVNEQLGYFRKIGDEAKALEAVSRSLELIEKLAEQEGLVPNPKFQPKSWRMENETTETLLEKGLIKKIV